MIPIVDTTLTVVATGIVNHSGHELATVAYFTLLRYEPNPDRRAIWIQSIRDFYGWEKGERNALEIAMMSSAIEDPAAVDAAQMLHEMTLDWREWLYDNSHRQDAETDILDRHDNEQFTVTFPYNEIRTLKWNTNPKAVSGGGNSASVQAPRPWLLPYWMMRYYGAIQ